MLAYAYEALNESATRRLATEPFEHIHDLFAAILARGVAYQIKRGLHRSYIQTEDALRVMRGALDITRTVRENSSGSPIAVCRFDEFSEDNDLNRIIKSTMLLLLTNGQVKDENKRALKKALAYFCGVQHVPAAELRFSLVRYDRSNQTYRLMIGVCELIHKGLLQSRQSGKTLLREYLDDEHMHALYERFIRNYYRHEHPELRPHAEHVAWNLDSGSDEKLLPIMKSDITLSENGRKLIIDAKYYAHSLRHTHHSDKLGLISGHLYQIFSYVKNMDVRRDGGVSGLLLYARTD